MFNQAVIGLFFVLTVGGFVVELCWMRNLIRQTLRDEEMMEAFRVVGRLIATPFRSVGASLGQLFENTVSTAQTVLWPKKKEEIE